jgi:hypothetical protein
MLRRTVHTVLGLAIGAISAAAPAAALTIGPGQGIEAPFSLTAPATGANTLTFNLVSVSGVGVTTMTVELYDGATLLGSVSGVSVNGVAAFVDVGSLWTTNAVSTDLASVRAGTIVGRIVVLPDFGAAGALSAQVSNVTSFAVGNGTDDETILPIAGVLSVGEEFAVPEPNGALLLLAGAVALRALRQRP